MKTSSCKAKGRRLLTEVKEKILTYFPVLHPDDLVVTPSGVTGEDLYFSPVARAMIPITVEGKNQESIQIWKALEQAESHAEKRKDLVPVLAFKRNRSKIYVALSLEHFLDLYVRGVSRRVEANRENTNSICGESVPPPAPLHIEPDARN